MEVGGATIVTYPRLLGIEGGRLLIYGVNVRAEIVPRNAGLAFDRERQFGGYGFVEAEPVEDGRLISADQLPER